MNTTGNMSDKKISLSGFRNIQEMDQHIRFFSHYTEAFNKRQYRLIQLNQRPKFWSKSSSVQ